jgi:hypothetical protein
MKCIIISCIFCVFICGVFLLVLSYSLYGSCKDIKLILQDYVGNCTVKFVSNQCNITDTLSNNECYHYLKYRQPIIKIYSVISDTCITKCDINNFNYKFAGTILLVLDIYCGIPYLLYTLIQIKTKTYKFISDQIYTCPICLDHVYQKDAVKITECKCSNEKPVMHEKCIYSWFAKNSTCPMCREIV